MTEHAAHFVGLRTPAGVAVAAGAVMLVVSDPLERDVVVSRLRADAPYAGRAFGLRALVSVGPEWTVQDPGGEHLGDSLPMQGTVQCAALDAMSDMFALRVRQGERLVAEVENLDGAPHQFFMLAVADACCSDHPDCLQSPAIGRACLLERIRGR